MQKLVNSINEKGVLHPIQYVESNGVNYIVDGHHRYFAAIRTGKIDIPVNKVSLPYGSYKNTRDLVPEGKMPGFWKYMKPK